MLPVQTLAGYPYNVNEEDSNTCSQILPIKNTKFGASKLIAPFPDFGKVDVYNTFKVRHSSLKVHFNIVSLYGR